MKLNFRFHFVFIFTHSNNDLAPPKVAPHRTAGSAGPFVTPLDLMCVFQPPVFKSISLIPNT